MTNYIDIAAMNVANNYPLIVYAKPEVWDLPPGTVMGHSHYSIMNQMRFIHAPGAEIEPKTGVVAGDLMRAWINTEYGPPIKRRKDQLVPRHPKSLYAKVGKHGDCVYIDQHKAYCQVLKLGWDVEYIRNQYIAAHPRPVPPEIRACKTAYSMAVSCSLHTTSRIRVMGKHEPYDRQPLNIYSNPCLFNLVHDTLNAIASEILAVLGEHCHYINTDGYIIQEGYEGYALDIIESWGFEAGVKTTDDGREAIGDCEVAGSGNYRVGPVGTLRDGDQRDHIGFFLDKQERLWLKRQWVKWQESIIKNGGY